MFGTFSRFDFSRDPEPRVSQLAGRTLKINNNVSILKGQTIVIDDFLVNKASNLLSSIFKDPAIQQNDSMSMFKMHYLVNVYFARTDTKPDQLDKIAFKLLIGKIGDLEFLVLPEELQLDTEPGNIKAGSGEFSGYGSEHRRQ